MGFCWYCYWGWSKEVATIYKFYESIAGESAMKYGPAHIVWSDENFDRESVQCCIDDFDEYSKDMTAIQKDAVMLSLREMLLLPDEIRDPEPKDYDDENPEKFPPKIEMEQLK